MSLTVDKLNYKYQFVKNNKYWDYNQVYNLNINGKEYPIYENDILLNISYDIVKNIDFNLTERNYMDNYEIPNIDIEQMKNIVNAFFMNIDKGLKNKIEFIFSKINFIKYDDNIPSDEQRSVTNDDEIKVYYKNDLLSLVTLAHEISHGISNLNDNCEISNDNKIECFAEIESELTEALFLQYLKDGNLQIRDKKTNDIRILNDNDIDDFKYNKYKSVLFKSCRAIDELEFKNSIKNKKINNIDEQFINDVSLSTNIDKNELMIRIERFINQYYPSDNSVNSYVGIDNYDLKNGKHLSNECRFIYAHCFVEKFNAMNLDSKEKIEFYRKYLKNAKTMSFSDVLSTFNVDLTNIHSFSDEFINEFNNLSGKNDSLNKSI